NLVLTQPSSAVVVLAAGAGTRMKSARQKTLHEIGGRSLLSHALHAAAGLNPEHIVAVVGHQRDQVSPAVDVVAAELGRDIVQAVQEEQKGTGHAVTVLSIELDDPTGYGRIVRNDADEVTAIVEHKDANDEQRTISEVNSGVFAFDASILRNALSKLDSNNSQGELYITDVVEIAREAGHRVGAFIAADAGELEGVNDRVQLAAAGRELNRRLVNQAMLNGANV